MSDKRAWIRKDTKEKYNLKRAWFVNAWRIVDSSGKDRVQPWSNTRKEAIETATQLGYEVVGDYDPSKRTQ
jgi:hypothetical protein